MPTNLQGTNEVRRVNIGAPFEGIRSHSNDIEPSFERGLILPFDVIEMSRRWVDDNYHRAARDRPLKFKQRKLA